MLAAAVKSAGKDHSACSGCSLCLLVCPVWRQTRDITMTPHGRSKALQNGVAVTDIAESIDSCTLCMACEPVCPEKIALVPMLLGLRRELAALATNRFVDTLFAVRPPNASQLATSARLMLGAAYAADGRMPSRIQSLLGGTVAMCEDNGADIALALEGGIEIPPARLAEFLAPLRKVERVIVADGLLLRQLREWLPMLTLQSLGEALSVLPGVRNALRKTDLYVIEPRAYHSDYERLVKYYSVLRNERGCSFNLDLQRFAIPATAQSLPQRLGKAEANDDMQARWVLQGRKIGRIVVESLDDGAALARVADVPIVHLADLAAQQPMVA
jgi:ferredoxin